MKAKMEMVDRLVEERDLLKKEMLTASPTNQLLHSWEMWGKAGDLQAQIDDLLEI